jgi:hypothetical protein
LVSPGLGTQRRYANDREKEEEILNGAEPWKDFRKEMEKEKKNIFKKKDRDEEDKLVKKLASTDLDRGCSALPDCKDT